MNDDDHHHTFEQHDDDDDDDNIHIHLRFFFAHSFLNFCSIVVTLNLRIEQKFFFLLLLLGEFTPFFFVVQNERQKKIFCVSRKKDA